MRDFLAGPTDDNRQAIERTFSLFITGNKQYSQLRMLTLQGQESLRVENSRSGPLVLEPDALQDKSSRGYFAAAQRLEPGEIYISQLDLNIEFGEIERPFNPVLRLVKAVPGRDGENAGFLVLNYSAQDIFKRLREPRDDEDISTVELVDGNSNWLIGPELENEWAWLLGDQSKTMAALLPELWQIVSSPDDHVIEYADTVLVHEHIWPGEDLVRPAIRTTFQDSLVFGFETPIKAETEWILIDVIERDELNSGALLNQSFVWAFIIALYMMLLLLSFAVSYFYGRQQHARAASLRESQRREKELGSYIESAPDGIVVSDPHGGIQRINSRVETMLGYSREELIGQSIDTLVPTRWRDGHSANRATFYSDPTLVGMKMGSDFFAETKDGSILPVDIALSALQTDDGVLTISALRDISALKETERQLKIAKRDSDKANQAKSEFLANMSHEIRTPLNAVLGSTYLLGQNKRLDTSAKAQVARIRRAGNALLSTINDILDLSKIEAGELRLEKRATRLSALLLDVDAVGHAQADQKDITFSVSDLPPALTLDVITDGVRLRQILLNLVSNAIKFTHKGSVHIEVQVVPAPHGAPQIEPDATNGSAARTTNLQWVAFSVCDTGIGIAPDLQKHLFEPFKQADSSTTRVFGGSGLGLTIVNELCQALGGQIRIVSEPGNGSCFTATLPFVAASEWEIEQAGLQVRPLEILVCQDDTKTGNTLQDICNQLGWRAELCPEGTALGKRLQRRFDNGNPADVLVLDGQSQGRCNIERLDKLISVLGPEQAPCTLLLNSSDPERLQNTGPLPALSVPVAIAEQPLSLVDVFNKINELKAKRLGCSSSLLSRTKMDQEDVLWLVSVRLLVVDDNSANLEVASSILKNQGAVVIGANNGAEALEWLRDPGNQVDFVLMDIQMPVMDGNQAVREIRKIERLKDLPVVALTAGALKSEKENALAAGMNDYLTKPFDPERMIRVIRQLMEQCARRVLPLQMRPAEAAANDAPQAWPDVVAPI